MKVKRCDECDVEEHDAWIETGEVAKSVAGNRFWGTAKVHRCKHCGTLFLDPVEVSEDG